MLMIDYDCDDDYVIYCHNPIFDLRHH